MKKLITFIFFIFFATFTCILTCRNHDENTSNVTQNSTNNKNLNILPLGDSRVEGATSNSVSYRHELWKHLVTNNWSFDFIGTQQDNTNYPYLLDKVFDPDHEGIGGYKTEDILNNITGVIQEVGVPDIVLLGIGGNDLLAEIPISESINNISETIDFLQNENPNVYIFIEKIAPGRSDIMTPENNNIFLSFNNNITTLAETKTNTTSKVIPVDMSENWSDIYFADTIHYNLLGAKEVANRYFYSLQEHISDLN